MGTAWTKCGPIFPECSTSCFGFEYAYFHNDIDDIIDRVGGGDSFSAGLIYGLLNHPGDEARALEEANDSVSLWPGRSSPRSQARTLSLSSAT